MEDVFIVRGGKPLKGEVQLSGAKNVALKVAIAALLFKEPVAFENIPAIKDVEELLHLMRSLGVATTFEHNKLTIDPSTLVHHHVDLLHGSKTRVSFLLFAPLLHKFGKSVIPNPGGCRIGARPIDRHIQMLESFGVEVKYDSNTGYYSATKADKLKAATFTFEKPTHTGTELAIMLAVLAQGVSIIKNAALEPEVDDLISFLNQAGARIVRNGSEITIEGVTRLVPSVNSYAIMYDQNEAVTYGVFALATRGDITVHGVKRGDITAFVDKVLEAGGGFEDLGESLRFFYEKPLTAVDIQTAVYPGFKTDWQSPWAVLMTQAQGTSIIHETVFEDRFGYVAELEKLGCRFEFFSPDSTFSRTSYQFNVPAHFDTKRQAIKIHGPSKLHNGVMQVRDLRAGATVLIAACTAQGESIINGASIIDRGYEHIEVKLQHVGADIARL